MAIGLHFAARSHIGLGRYKNNQDSGYAGPYLIAVADGMGGAAGGDVASSTVVGELARLDTDNPGPDPAQHLVEAITAANTAMREQVEAKSSLHGMGSTCTALLRVGSQLILAHVGDSRGYLMQDGTLRQVTHDHTFVQRLVDTGQITEDEAERHPQRSVILRVVGHLDDDDDIDTATLDAAIGQRWLLCSDGLPRVVSADTIRDALAQDATPEQTAERLVDLALRAGGPDNITVIVADVVNADGDHPPPAIPEVVGAAALPDTMPAILAPGAAGRAPDLTSPDQTGRQAAAHTSAAPPDPDQDDDEPRRPRWITNALVGMVILAVLAASLVGLRTWFRTQYYVGIEGDNVAIFRGWNESLGPLNQPTLHLQTTLPVATLTTVNQDRLRTGIEPDSLTAAERTVRELWKSSALCADTPAGQGGDASATRTATPGTPGAPDAPDALLPLSPAPTNPTPSMPAPDVTAGVPAAADTVAATPATGETAGAPAAPPSRPPECDQ